MCVNEIQDNDRVRGRNTCVNEIQDNDRVRIKDG